MIHEVNTRTFLLKDKLLRSQRHGSVREEPLDYLRVTEHGLFWGLAVDGTNITYMQAHILKGLNVQVSRFGWKDHVKQEHKLDFYIDMIHLTEKTDARWHCRDLYLDIALYEGNRAAVLDTDEYLAAVKAGYLDAVEAELSLTKLHEVINDLAKHSYSLVALLKQQNIQLEWA